MTRIYFQQEVLSKYEGVAGFDVGDDGSVRCGSAWGLERSTGRIGNELLSTAIGDFAEGVPYREWQHWLQFAVSPPDTGGLTVLRREEPLPESVNRVLRSFMRLNEVFARLVEDRTGTIGDVLWSGSTESLAARQLKWVYPTNAGDDTFMQRATLLSVLVLDELNAKPLRNALQSFATGLHQGSDGNPLASRRLLQRLVIAATISRKVDPTVNVLADCVRAAEGEVITELDLDVITELKEIGSRVRQRLAPLAHLYDLRNAGGIAHSPDPKKVAATCALIGLPTQDWHRTDYATLLRLVTSSADAADEALHI